MKFKFIFSLVCLLVMMAAANAGAAALTISAKNPAAGAISVPVNTTVSVTFTTNPATGSLICPTNISFYLKQGLNPVTTTISCSGKTATLTPTSPLLSSTVYTAYVTTGVKDSNNNTLASNFSWSFTTVVVPPTVLSVLPVNGAIGQLPTVAPTATFSETMDPATIVSPVTTFTLIATVSGTPVSGTVTYDVPSKTATFTPFANLNSLTKYTATITTGVKNQDSPTETAMAANFTWSFTIKDTVPPSVLAYTPTPSGVTGQAITVKATATFSEVLNTATLTSSAFTLTDPSGATVPATLTFVASSTVAPCSIAVPCTIATLTPNSSLAYSTTYTATITGVTDVAGNAIAAPFVWTFTTTAVPMANYCVAPAFVSAPIPPNVLFILDDSQSFDEDFNGNAVSSIASSSKSVVGRKALINIVNTYAKDMRIGIMTYKQAAASKWSVHNSPYFASYRPQTYCPNPPTECVDYCERGVVAVILGDGTNTTNKAYCQSECGLQNPLFNAELSGKDSQGIPYFDEIINLDMTISPYAIGSAQRNTYCPLVYPKTNEVSNPTDPANFIYHKQPGQFYDSSNDGTAFCYSTGYNAHEGAPWDQFNCFTSKTSSSLTPGGPDGTCGLNPPWQNGYGGTEIFNQIGFVPTDSDYALGFNDFGRRNWWYYTGPTWFSDTSPGPGLLNLACNTNVPPTNTQLNTLLTLLTTHENDAVGYMSCGSNIGCSYIVNAGLTPTAGTLQSAINYFQGTYAGQTSPIQYRCQKNFIIYVTDGSPSTDEFGVTPTDPASVAALMPTVLTKIDNLRNITDTLSGTPYNFDVKTYVLGLGLAGNDVTNVNAMAVHGGTDQSGQAYFASSSDELNTALANIFQNILNKVSAGTAASVLASGQGSGANIVQAVFYPMRTFTAGQQVAWVGTLQNLWYYLDPTSQNSTIRTNDISDGSGNPELKLDIDSIVNFRFDQTAQATLVDLYADANGDNVADSSTPTSTVNIEDLDFIWEAGTVLWQRTSARTIKTTIGSGLINFTAANRAALYPYMQTLSLDETEAIIDYINGQDAPITVTDGTTYPISPATYRSRTTPVDLNGNGSVSDPGESAKVWKLSDIIDSTPRIVSWIPLNKYDVTYGDQTYASFLKTTTYTNRGMVFAGGNDGMLHAFKLGTLQLVNDGSMVKAKLTNPDTTTPLGTEAWAFIPENSLPYLRYLSDPAYCHVYYVDATPYIFDASINVDTTTVTQPASCNSTDGSTDLTKGYFNCTKTVNSWRTVLIGGMRTGGGCATAATSYEVQVPMKVSGQGVGYSSYFALDITDPTNPTLLWEFSNPALGYSTTGPAIVRLSAQQVGTDGKGHPHTELNGKWSVVFASGPTGPIDTTNHEFDGYSDQTLKLFVLDLTTGKLLNTIDTLIPNAFGGSLNNGNNDYDFDYQDDVVYVGYTKAETPTLSSSTIWSQGGVIRLLTKSLLTGNEGSGYNVYNTALNPLNWEWSYVAKDIGPVTAAISHIAHYPTSSTYPDKGYLYFGTGRFFFKTTVIDNASVQSRLFGIVDPCMTKMIINSTSVGLSSKPTMSVSTRLCNDTVLTNTVCSVINANDIVDIGGETCLGNATADQINVTTYPYGWFINLANPSSGSLLAERVITDTLPTSTGIVFFTTFSPSTDVCNYGGTTNMWAVRYDNAGSVNGMLQGKALLQTSTGVINQVTLSTAFNSNLAGGRAGEGRSTTSGVIGGDPAPGAPAFVVPPKPLNKVMSVIKKTY